MIDQDQKVPIDLKAYGRGLYSLRVWHGMALDAWLRIMRGKWHLIPRSRYPLVAMITVFSIGNQFLKWATQLIYGRRLRATKISPDPIFVIGYWRSGTTWLHQLMMADPRHAAPDIRAVFSPETFLAGRAIINLILKYTLQETRPMDNVAISADSAEEDEHAIYLSGAMSPRFNALFPCNPQDYPYNPRLLDPKDAAFWRRKWLAFLTRVQFTHPGKRLVLKSPGHTLRTAEILTQFPNAQFIHILRDPYKIFMSGMKTRSAMDTVSTLEEFLPSPADQEARLIKSFVAFHDQFEADRKNIPAGQITTVRYEDLKADPLGVVRQIYQDLGLTDCALAEPGLRKSAGIAKPYQNNKYELDDHIRALVEREFANYFERYDYLPMAQRPKAGK